ncbi:MAG: epimerase, partial [Candidatus Saccharibacteria bacterium]
LAQICVAWEAVWAPLEAVGIRVVSMRTGVVIGRGGGIMGALLPVYKLGLGPIIGTGNEYFSWVGMHDLVRMYEFALNTKALSGPVNAVSPNPVTTREFAKTIGKVVHRPVFVPSPIWLMDIALNGAAKDGFASARVVPTKLSAAGFVVEQGDLSLAIEAAV